MTDRGPQQNCGFIIVVVYNGPGTAASDRMPTTAPPPPYKVMNTYNTTAAPVICSERQVHITHNVVGEKRTHAHTQMDDNYYASLNPNRVPSHPP